MFVFAFSRKLLVKKDDMTKIFAKSKTVDFSLNFPKKAKLVDITLKGIIFVKF